MTELWQTYESWVIYGAAFILMVLLHGRTHGGHAHAGHSHAGHAQAEPRRSHTRHRGGCC